MATTITNIKPSGESRYGHNKDGSTNSKGTGTLYMGSCDGGSNYLHFGSSIPFKITNPTEDGSPVIITSATLNTQRRNYTPFNNSSTKNNNCVYINQTAAPAPNDSGVTNRSNGIAFTATTDLSKYLNELSTYVSNSSTFYIHILDSTLPLTGRTNSAGAQGGTIYGSGESKRPTLTLTWEYANSNGKLSSTNFNVGSSVTFTLNVKGTNYYHNISCKINGADSGIDFSSLTSSAFTNVDKTLSFTLSPTLSQIVSWFGTNKTSATGVITIQTYKDSGKTTKIGDTATINFTLNLPQSYLNSLTNYVPKSSAAFTHAAENNPVIARYSKYTVTNTITNNSSGAFSLVNHTITVANAYNGTLTKNAGTNTTATISGVVINRAALKYTVTLKDARGYSYSTTITQSSPTFTSYSVPVINTLNLYRTKLADSKYSAATDGTFLGGTVKITFSSGRKGSYTLKCSKSSLSGSNLSGVYTNSSTSLDGTIENTENKTGRYSTSESYTFTLTANDDILDNSNYNKPDGYVTQTFTLSKAEFIIHISDNGKGLGFMTGGEEGYICLGKPVKGLTIPITGGTISLADLNSKQALCDRIGAAYVEEGGNLETVFLTATDSVLTNDVLSKDGKLLMRYLKDSPSLTIGNTVSNLVLQSKSLSYSINGTSYSPVFEYNAGDTVQYVVDGYSTSSIDDIVLSAANFYGYLTASRSSLNITINLAKPIHKDKIDGIKFSSFKALIRTDEYYTLQKTWDNCYDSSTKLFKKDTTLVSGRYKNNAIDYLPLLSNTFSGSSNVENNFSKICFDNNGYANQIIVCFRSDGKIYGTGDNGVFYGNTNTLSMCSALDIQFTFTKGSTTGVYK